MRKPIFSASEMSSMGRSSLAVSIALLSAGLVAIGPGQVWGKEIRMEEVMVTGTRMRGAEAPVGSSVISLDRSYIEKSSAISVDKLLQEAPQIFDLGVSEASRGQPGGNGNKVYGNSINLRGIGPYSTLALVDGHRVVTNSRNIEPSVLPGLALERMVPQPSMGRMLSPVLSTWLCVATLKAGRYFCAKE